jgi:hypothetical protein
MSSARTGTVPMPSIQSVIAGLHDDGETVTLTGVLNDVTLKRTKQGNDWATFTLTGEKAVVDVLVFPKIYRQFGDLLGPITGPDDTLLPPTVTVTARVCTRGLVHSLYADKLWCHDHDEHGPHPHRPLPAAVRTEMDLAAIARIVGRAVQVIRENSGKAPAAATATAALNEIGAALYRYGYCDDPAFPPEAGEAWDIDDLLGLLRGVDGEPE